MNLRRIWDSNAEVWIAWARLPDHDHFFWEFNLPAFTGLLPGKTGRLLDLGCGEGRVGRHMRDLGFQVYGADGSPAMARAAAGHPKGFSTVVADAAALPFRDDSFDVVVAFMLLHDLDDLDAGIAEAARVLRDDGVLCASIMHPFYSSGWITLSDRTVDRTKGSYFDTWTYLETVGMGNLSLGLNSMHRPISAYIGALAQAGMSLEVLNEPRPSTEYLGRHPDLADLDNIPFWLHFRARKTRTHRVDSSATQTATPFVSTPSAPFAG